MNRSLLIFLITFLSFYRITSLFTMQSNFTTNPSDARSITVTEQLVLVGEVFNLTGLDKANELLDKQAILQVEQQSAKPKKKVVISDQVKQKESDIQYDLESAKEWTEICEEMVDLYNKLRHCNQQLRQAYEQMSYVFNEDMIEEVEEPSDEYTNKRENFVDYFMDLSIKKSKLQKKIEKLRAMQLESAKTDNFNSLRYRTSAAA